MPGGAAAEASSQPGDKIRVIAGWMAPGFLTDLLPPEEPSGEEPSV